MHGVSLTPQTCVPCVIANDPHSSGGSQVREVLGEAERMWGVESMGLGPSRATWWDQFPPPL